MRALQDGSGLVDRLALEVGNPHRFRAERRHERHRLALLERRTRGGVGLRDILRRDVQPMDAVGDLHGEPRSLRVALASSMGVPISGGTSAWWGIT